MKVSGLVGLAIVSLCVGIELSSAATVPCALRETTYGSVCVCNATYCDSLDPINPSSNDEIVLTSSSKNGLRFDTKIGRWSDGKVVVNDPLSDDVLDGPMVMLVDGDQTLAQFPSKYVNLPKRTVSIQLDRSKKFQKITGFGGAFTGAVSYLLDQLPQELQDAVYKSFYSKEGIALTMMRMSIGGCDFDLEPWAYNEVPENDPTLSSFTRLDPRDERKIEQLERLKSVAGIDKIKIMAAAWSPPKWMKTNNAWTGFSSLKKEYYQTWADYHLQFLRLMKAKGMPIWAISTGNEPLNGVFWMAFVRFMSLGWTPRNQAIWLTENLGPTIRNSELSDVKIFCNDDQRYTFPMWFKVMNATRRDSLGYLDGLAVHWYWDDFVGPSTIDATVQMLPDKLLLSTESCVGDKPFTASMELGSWSRGEKYAHSFLQDLQHSFNGYIDWNIVLDEEGGPNYVKNYVDAPAVVNLTSADEFYKQPIYYAIGHFSKFIPEGSVRIQAECSNINIVTVAFERPDGSISAVLLNSGRAAVDVTLVDSVRGNIVISIPQRSLHTVVYN